MLLLTLTGYKHCGAFARTPVERWDRTPKNRILLERYYLPGDLESQAAAAVAHCKHARHHERKIIRGLTIANRRLQHRLRAA